MCRIAMHVNEESALNPEGEVPIKNPDSGPRGFIGGSWSRKKVDR